MSKPATAAEALVRLEALCARAEHCQSEMRDKLRTWGIGAGEADKVVRSLCQRKFIDDARYARAYVHDKFAYQKWGRRKIAQGLMAKRIDRDIITDALSTIGADEYSHAIVGLLQAKLRLEPAMLGTFAGRTRLYRFALQRGYEPTIISSAMKNLVN